MNCPFHFPDLALGWSAGETNALTLALQNRRTAGFEVIDLVDSNATALGFTFPPEILAEIAMHAATDSNVYRPDPLGARSARQAVAAWYARRRVKVADPSRIALTPGTSMAYFYAFRLLAEPGEAALIPAPGYPLFDELAAVAETGLRHYPLEQTSKGWRYDADAIDETCEGDERVLIVVAPHNPTGATPTPEDWTALGELCRRRNLALIVDEVFCESLTPGAAPYARPRHGDFPLVLTFNGVSKMLALPQWKLGWIKVCGDDDNVSSFMRAFEFMSDAFLPLPGATQAMLPGLLEAGDGGVIRQMREELDRRRALALRSLAWPVEPCQAGPYLCLRLPKGADDEALAVEALETEGILVHPGFYYEMPAHLVMTCLARPDTLREGAARLNRLYRRL